MKRDKNWIEQKTIDLVFGHRDHSRFEIFWRSTCAYATMMISVVVWAVIFAAVGMVYLTAIPFLLVLYPIWVIQKEEKFR